MKRAIASVAIIGATIGLVGCVSEDKETNKDNEKHIEVSEELLKEKIDKLKTTEEKQKVLTDEFEKLIEKEKVFTDGNIELSEKEELIGKEFIVLSKNKDLESIVYWQLIIDGEEKNKLTQFDEGMRYLSLKDVGSGTISLENVYLLDVQTMNELGYTSGLELYEVLAGIENYDGEGVYHVGTDIDEGVFNLRNLNDAEVKKLFKNDDEYNRYAGVFGMINEELDIKKLNQALYIDANLIKNNIAVNLKKGDYLWIKDLTLLEEIKEENLEDKAIDESSGEGKGDIVTAGDDVSTEDDVAKEIKDDTTAQ